MRFLLIALTAVSGACAVETMPDPSPVEQLPQTIRTQLVQTTGGATIVDVQVEPRNGDPQYVARYRDTVSGEMKTVRLGKLGNVIDQGSGGSGGITSDKKRMEATPDTNNQGAVVVPRPTPPTTIPDPQPLTTPGRTPAMGIDKTDPSANGNNKRNNGTDANTQRDPLDASTTTPNDGSSAKPTDKPSVPSSGSSGKPSGTGGKAGGGSNSSSGGGR